MADLSRSSARSSLSAPRPDIRLNLEEYSSSEEVADYHDTAATYQVTLLMMDANGLMDYGQSKQLHTYCSVQVQGADGKRKVGRTTQVQSQDGNVAWNEGIVIQDFSTSDYYLCIYICNKGRNRNVIGTCYVPILPLLQSSIASSFPITTLQGEFKGTLQLRVRRHNVPHAILEPVQHTFDELCRLCCFDVAMKIADGRVSSFFKDKERIEVKIENAVVALAGTVSNCTVYLTNYRLVITSARISGSKRESDDIAFAGDETPMHADLVHRIPLQKGFINVAIPLGNIIQATFQDHVDAVVRPNMASLLIQCFTFLQLTLSFAGETKANAKQMCAAIEKRLVRQALLRSTVPLAVDTAHPEEHPVRPGWDLFDMGAEFERQEAPSNKWRKSLVNRSWRLCESYPEELWVPASLRDDQLLSAATVRARRRLPVLTYYYKHTGGSIVRTAQPMSGAAPDADQVVLQAIQDTTSGTDKQTIVDVRSKVAAGSARFYRSDRSSAHMTYRVRYMGIAGFDAMRESIDHLSKACVLQQSGDWFRQLGDSQWMSHLSSILGAAVQVATYLRQRGTSVILHGGDGWDRTSQVAALAQLMLDPFYRTFKGFQILIEKEFIRFGHKFRHRLYDPKHPNERSPIFQQFLDLTWQMLQQFPTAFEFSDVYLLALFQHLYSGFFGNMIDNSHKNVVLRRLNCRSESIWAYLDAFASDPTALNPLYEAHSDVILPMTSIKTLRLWREAYLGYDESALQLKLVHTLNNTEDDSDDLDLDLDMHHLRSSAVLRASQTNLETVDGPVLFKPNRKVGKCTECRAPFGLFRRKNHCRVCGDLFCDACIQKSVLPGVAGLKDTKQKICDRCISEK